jgi:uncharacterized protein (TIGR02145 family)
LCPDGWDVPTDAEWTILITYLGGGSVAGGKMKSTGTDYWNSPNTDATNSSGFSALPGGSRNTDGSFANIRNFAFFWSATGPVSDIAIFRTLYGSSSFVTSNQNLKSVGASVRCLKD